MSSVIMRTALAVSSKNESHFRTLPLVTTGKYSELSAAAAACKENVG